MIIYSSDEIDMEAYAQVGVDFCEYLKIRRHIIDCEVVPEHMTIKSYCETVMACGYKLQIIPVGYY